SIPPRGRSIVTRVGRRLALLIPAVRRVAEGKAILAQELSDAVKATKVLQTEVVRLRQEKGEIQRKLDAEHVVVERLQNEYDILKRDQSHVMAERDVIQSKLDSARDDLVSARCEREGARGERDSARSELESMRNERDALRTERDQAVGRLDVAMFDQRNVLA